MKNIFLLILIISVGCTKPNVKETNQTISLGIYSNMNAHVYEWEYKNHTYIVIRGSHSQVSIAHAGHCNCKN